VIRPRKVILILPFTRVKGWVGLGSVVWVCSRCLIKQALSHWVRWVRTQLSTPVRPKGSALLSNCVFGAISTYLNCRKARGNATKSHFPALRLTHHRSEVCLRAGKDNCWRRDSLPRNFPQRYQPRHRWPLRPTCCHSISCSLVVIPAAWRRVWSWIRRRARARGPPTTTWPSAGRRRRDRSTALRSRTSFAPPTSISSSCSARAASARYGTGTAFDRSFPRLSSLPRRWCVLVYIRK